MAFPGPVPRYPNLISTTSWMKTVRTSGEIFEPVLRSAWARHEFLEGMKGNPVSRQLTLEKLVLVSEDKREITLDFKGIRTESGKTKLTWVLLPSVEGNFECVRTYWPNLILTYKFPTLSVNLGTTLFFDMKLGVVLPLQVEATPITHDTKLPWE